MTKNVTLLKFSLSLVVALSVLSGNFAQAFNVEPTTGSGKAAVGYFFKPVTDPKTGFIWLFECEINNPNNCSTPLRPFTKEEIKMAVVTVSRQLLKKGLLDTGATAVGGCGGILAAAWVFGFVPVVGQVGLGGTCVIVGAGGAILDLLGGPSHMYLKGWRDAADNLENGLTSAKPIVYQGNWLTLEILLGQALRKEVQNGPYVPVTISDIERMKSIAERQ